MGIQPFLIPASFNAVIAQRLIRKLCPHCKKEIGVQNLDKDTLYNIQNALKLTKKTELTTRVSPEILKNPKFYEPVGCEHCDNT
jgi:type II secretory ATPase GspE/PulE/Tfp pilus assembly ATPase PilB-like protein